MRREGSAAQDRGRVALALSVSSLLGLSMLMLVACDVDTAAPPTATATFIGIAPSQTIDPAVPTSGADGINPEALNFTPGARPTSVFDRASTVTPSPLPTQPTIPMQFAVGDGPTIAGRYFGTAARPAPTLLLLHGVGGTSLDWDAFAAQLQKAGYNVLALDLRGHGLSAGSVNWPRALQDVESIFPRLRILPGVNQNRVSIVGANVGANLALNACADLPECRSTVLLSPALDYQEIGTAQAMPRMGKRPVMIVASRADNPSGPDSAQLDRLAQGDHLLVLLDGDVNGTKLLSAQPDLGATIIQWLSRR